MQHKFELIDPPRLVEVKHYKVDDLAGIYPSQPFCHFIWHDRDYWLLGKRVWHNTVQVGFVHLRLPHGRRLMNAVFLVQPNYEPKSFCVNRPSDHNARDASSFVFAGIPSDRLVDIEFIKHDDTRISDLIDRRKWYRENPITRPPSGHLV
jgi:hypothetical protein